MSVPVRQSLRLARGDIWHVRPARPSRPAHAAVPEAVQSALDAQPFVVLSPGELNDHLQTVILAPVRSAGIDAPFRPALRFAGTRASIALDQLRTVERRRLVKRIGRVSPPALKTALAALETMFAP